MGLLIKFIVPLALAYLAYRSIRKAFFPSAPEHAGNSRIIEICPKCGHEKKTQHSC